MKYYDSSFKELFSNKRLIVSLLKNYVKAPWVELLDFDSMRIEQSEFVGIADDKRESDLLITFNRKDESELSIFLLLEFQSTYESMLLRLLEYLVRVFRKQLQTTGKLHPVVPIVIYNGKEHWKEAQQFHSQFYLSENSPFAPYIPAFEYVLIDESRYNDTFLAALEDEVSYLFRVDKTDLREIDSATDRIAEVLSELSKGDKELFDLIRRFAFGLIQYKGIEVEKEDFKQFLDTGGRSMLAQSVQELKQEGRQEGRQEGAHEARLEAAELMLADGTEISFVVKYLGLPENEVKELKKKMSAKK